MATSRGVSLSLIKKLKQEFEVDPKNRLAQNVCTTQPLREVLSSRSSTQTTQHCFSHKIETEGNPVTNQKGSGRCWIFSCLNIMRVPFMKKFKLESFEFSQTYLYFWDKLERANYLLTAFVECAKKGETYEGRLVSHLLKNPSDDGGQWDMLVNLVEKYGVVPKVCFPESWCAENSGRLGMLTNNMYREACMSLQKMVKEGKSEADIEAEKNKYLGEIYRILCIVLGSPPETFSFQYYAKGEGESKPAFQTIGPMTPLEFYQKHIKPDCLDMEDLVCITNDPRPQNPYSKLYTVEYLGNVVGGRNVLYINQPVEVLKELAIKTLVDEKQPVWFGCDVGKQFRLKEGFLDLKCLEYELMFGVDVLKQGKAERLMFGESFMTHAMVLTGVNLIDEEKRKADKWRIENSWGDSDSDKGYLVMTDDWFTEFVYEVVISKKLLSPELLAVLDQEPKVLPAWDPMGSLARL